MAINPMIHMVPCDDYFPHAGIAQGPEHDMNRKEHLSETVFDVFLAGSERAGAGIGTPNPP